VLLTILFFSFSLSLSLIDALQVLLTILSFSFCLLLSLSLSLSPSLPPHWGLKSGLRACEAGAPPLEPHLRPFLLYLFLIGSGTLPRQAWTAIFLFMPPQS
jgi:hypothetical protein